MKILDPVQGSPEWLAARAVAGRRCASESAAMMGHDDRLSRSELVRMKASGDEREFSDYVRKYLLDPGHELEAMARVILEGRLGEDLYPATMVTDDGVYLASSDGAVMDGTLCFEHKSWNEQLAAEIRARELSPKWYWQLESLIKVGGFERVLFVCSNGTPEKWVEMEYTAVPGRWEALEAGWKQFDEDVKNYVHVEVLPKAVADPVMQLPAVSVQVSGAIEVVSNLPRFGERLKEFIEGIDKNPTDDQAFANAEEAVKTLAKAEAALLQAESAALAQTTTIDEMRQTVATYHKLARDTRLMLEKLVEAKKVSIRDDIRRKGAEAFGQHIVKLNERLGAAYMPPVVAKFSEVMKGKKTIVSLRDAVATEVARAKIEANAIADRIQLNLRTLHEEAKDYAFLFADTAQIVLKENEHFALLVRTRIADHKRKEDERLEAERERIRQEEAAKLQPKPIPAAVPAPASAAKPAAPAVTVAAKSRPSDDEIIAALALHYRVHESTVIAWLLDVDLDSASERMTKEFAA